MQLSNQRSTLDVMDFILTLQEETELKLKVATLSYGAGGMLETNKSSGKEVRH